MKSAKRLFAILLSATLISTNALAAVPNKVAVIGNKAFDLEYVNDPKNIEEIRELLSQGKRIMVKARNQWYNKHGESKAEKYAPPKLIYKNVDGEVKEITTDYFEKQVSIVIGIESPSEIKVIFNDEVDKQLLTKENLKINGIILGDKDHIDFDEDKKILTIKVQEELNLEKNLEMSLKINEEDTVEKNVRVVNSQEDVNEILESEGFFDLVVMGDDINLKLEGIDGNVFLNGKNIEISELKTTYLQISENSDKIKLKESKIDTLNTAEGIEVVLEETEVQETITTENTQKSETSTTIDDDDYVSEWITARVENVKVPRYNKIRVEFEKVFDEIVDNQHSDNFTIIQNGKEFSVDTIYKDGKEICFSFNTEIKNIEGEWIIQNKLVSGSPVILKYNADKQNGLKINSKYVRSFEIKSEVVQGLKSADDAVIKVEEGQAFDGVINNENKVIKIYEDMLNEQLGNTLYATANAHLMISEQDESRTMLLIGEDGSINDYSIVRAYRVESIIMDSQVSIEAGETKKLEAKVMPENAENKVLTWSTSDSDTVSVDQNGSIKGLKEGIATIIARTENGIEAECTVVVGKPAISVNSVKTNAYNRFVMTFNEELKADSELESLFEVYNDGKLVSNPLVQLEDNAIKIIIYPNLQLIDNEFIVRDKFSKGNEITVKYLGGENGLRIGDYEVKSFEEKFIVSEDFQSLDGLEVGINDNSFPGEIVGNEVILFSELGKDFHEIGNVIREAMDCNQPVDRLITAAYENYIFLIAQDGSVKAYEVIERIQNISFATNESELMKIGEETEVEFINQNKMKLILEVEGDDIIKASMEEGKVSIEALSEGTGLIRIIGEMVRSDGSIVEGNNVVITKEINVIPVEVENVVLPSKVEIQQGDSYQLEAKIFPDNATHKELTWTSLDENIATVDENGMVTAVEIGEAVIMVETQNGITATCIVNVVEKIHRISVTVNGNKVQLILQDISADQKEVYLTVQNKTNGNIAVFNKYDLVQGENIIEFELENGTYEGYMNIDGLKKFKIDTFTVEADN